MENETSKPVRWDMIVESDRVLSPKNGKWYTVEATSAAAGGKVRVRFEGVAKPFDRPADETAQVIRGATGQASEVLMRVLYSGGPA